MKRTGVPEMRRVLGKYVQQLKSGVLHIRTGQSDRSMMISVVTVTSDLPEFSQGMILPTTDGPKQLPTDLSKKNQIKTSKTQVEATSVPDLVPYNVV